MRLHPPSCGLGMLLPTPVLGGRSFPLQPKGTRIQWELRRKQILEEVVNLSISFLSFINGDWKERELFREHSVLFFLVSSWLVVESCQSLLFLACGKR